ncbi:MAG: hypothetical protein WBM62_13880 [Crocosphaera sp.]
MNQQQSEKQQKALLTKVLKIGGLTGIILTGITLISLPSVGAFQVNIGGYNLNFTDFNSFWQSALPQLQQNLGSLPSLDNLGSLGIPDIFVVKKEIEAEKGHEGWDEIHETTRIMADVFSQKTLSNEGQKNVEDTQQAIQQQIDNIKVDAQLASLEQVTQNVLKHMANQTTRQGTIMGVIQNDLAQLKLKQDTNNLLTSNISKTVDRAEKREEQEQSARVNSALEILGYVQMYK